MLILYIAMPLLDPHAGMAEITLIIEKPIKFQLNFN